MPSDTMTAHTTTTDTTSARPPGEIADRDMVRVPGGTFRMGSDEHYPEEAPVHRVTVDGFWIDRTPVTNRQFKAFVKATGHVTFAEITPSRRTIPARCRTCSTPARWCSARRRMRSICATGAQWWTFMRGADWRHPYGPGATSTGSTIIRSCTSPIADALGLRAMGRQGAADRSRMGVRGARRARRRGVRLGR